MPIIIVKWPVMHKGCREIVHCSETVASADKDTATRCVRGVKCAFPVLHLNLCARLPTPSSGTSGYNTCKCSAHYEGGVVNGYQHFSSFVLSG